MFLLFQLVVSLSIINPLYASDAYAQTNILHEQIIILISHSIFFLRVLHSASCFVISVQFWLRRSQRWTDKMSK